MTLWKVHDCAKQSYHVTEAYSDQDKLVLKGSPIEGAVKANRLHVGCYCESGGGTT